MLVTLLAFGLVDLLALLALAIALYRAPEGYQSHDGFHFGPGCDTDAPYYPRGEDAEPAAHYLTPPMMAGSTGC
jgi:hypothetical protein